MSNSSRASTSQQGFAQRREPEVLTNRSAAAATTSLSQCIDWYAEGQSRTVIIDGQEIVIRFLGRKGRRGRIAIAAPAGAQFIEQ